MGDSFGHYPAVIYGGTLPGVSALRSLRAVSDGLEVLFVNPQPGWGGQAGIGRQNSWDLRDWQRNGEAMTAQGGTFRHWYDSSGLSYDPTAFEALVGETVRDTDGVDLLDYWDVVDLERTTEGSVDRIEVAPLKRTGGETKQSGESVVFDADTFIDASESGRLARLANVPYTVGRASWERDNRQMAATLMFAMEGVEWRTIEQNRSPDGQRTYGSTTDAWDDQRLFWGGQWYARESTPVQEFNEAFPRFRLKALNAAEGRSGVFWFNALLIYDVDGRYDTRDDGKILKHDQRPWHRDEARERAVAAITDDRFRAAMRAFPGLKSATLVDRDGSPAIAESVYLRETIHMRRDSGYAVTENHVLEAGDGPDNGADADLYDTRVGLCYYWMDNNGYDASRPSDDAEFYATDNPVYLPYEVLVPKTCSNLLVPGYAASFSSRAWFEARVLPNLCVLGDAAGVAAAVATEDGVPPGRFESRQIERTQESLVDDVGAILEKDLSHGTVDR